MNENLFHEIRLNRIRLDACPQHKFEDDKPFEDVLGQGYVVCVNCKGKMSLGDVNQYLRGFHAAGGDTNQVWESFLQEGDEIEARCPKCTIDKISFFAEVEICKLCNNKHFVTASKAHEYLKGYDKKENSENISKLD